MEGITAVAKENTPLALSPNLFYERGDARVTSRGTVYRVVALPEHLLVQIKIGMAVVHLNDCKVFSAAHFLFSPFLLVQGVLWVFASFPLPAAAALSTMNQIHYKEDSDCKD